MSCVLAVFVFISSSEIMKRESTSPSHFTTNG